MIVLSLPKISIIMPVLNGAKTFEKALKSVLDQHYPNLELIIIDAGSTDGTIDIICRYLTFISYWHSHPDGGPIVGVNKGLEKATGDLIVLLMADDWYESQTLIKIGQAYLEHPDAEIFSCGGRIVFYDQKTQRYKAKWTYASSKKMALTFNNICFDVASAICCRFIKKTVFEKIGFFFPFDSLGRPLLSNDKEFLLRAMIHQVKHHYVDYLGHNYLAHSGSSTFGNHKKNILKLCYEHMEIIDALLKKYHTKLSLKQKFLLMYWYNDQATRLFLYKLLDLKFISAWRIFKNALRQYTVFWPIAFIQVTCKIVMKRSWRLVRRVIVSGS